MKLRKILIRCRVGWHRRRDGAKLSEQNHSLHRAVAARGGADVLSRIVSPKLGEALGQQVIIDYRSGAAGNIGAGWRRSRRPTVNDRVCVCRHPCDQPEHLQQAAVQGERLRAYHLDCGSAAGAGRTSVDAGEEPSKR